MSRSLILALFFLLALCSLLFSQNLEDDADTISADTLYDPEYYSDDDVESIKEYLDPEGVEMVDGLADIGPYPIHTVLLGPRAGYLFYDEIFNQKDMQELAATEGFYIKQIIGWPKSTEYGVWPGFSFQYRYIGPNVPVFITIPKISFAIGIFNTYDGSRCTTMYVNPEKDTADVQYFPATFQKMNLFLNYGFDLGYLFVIKKFRLSVNSGIDGRIWVRDLVDRSETLPEGVHFRNNEVYSWIYFPINASFSFQPTNKFSIGVLAGLDFMASGSMQINLKMWDAYDAIEANAEKVKLANTLGYHAALLIEPRLSRARAVKFSPFIHYYQFGRSNIGTITIQGDSGHFYEPASKTIVVGIDITFMIFTAEKKQEDKILYEEEDEEEF